MQILAFNLLNEELGFDITSVREILKPPEIHPFPQAPDFIEGLIDLRGRIIAVMDLRKRFNIKAGQDSPKMRIVICKIKKFIVGFIVDSVSGIITLSKEEIQPTPEVISMQIEDSCVACIAKVKERIITILNLEGILTKEELDKLSKMKK